MIHRFAGLDDVQVEQGDLGLMAAGFTSVTSWMAYTVTSTVSPAEGMTSGMVVTIDSAAGATASPATN